MDVSCDEKHELHAQRRKVNMGCILNIPPNTHIT